MRIIIGLVFLFFLIFFHELGHFIAAKIFGVKVEAFSIGLGPVLLHREKGGTDYRLSLVPFGGYCAMKGEKDFQKSLDADLNHIEAEKDSMYGVHPFKRLLIAFAGPFFNLFFAFFALTCISLTGYSYYSFSNKIDVPDENNHAEISSVAKEAGIQSGDSIIKIDGKKTEDFSDLIAEISAKPDQNISVTVLRGGKEMEFNLHTEMDRKTGGGKIGIIARTESLERKTKPPKWLFPAVAEGFMETCRYSALTVKGFFMLFKGVDLSETVSGPARIADMMGQAVKESFGDSVKTGIVNTLTFMAVISISLGIMNLLPVPVLDGGLILFAFIELVFRRKLPPKVLYYIHFVGIAFIAVMFVIGINGDIHYFVNLIKGNK